MSELNLIPYELKLERVKKYKIKNYISYGIVVFAIIFLIIVAPKLYLIKLNSDEAKVNDKISRNIKIISENKKLLSAIENYNLYNSKVDVLTKQKSDVTGRIKSLEKYIPKDITLNSIGYAKGALTLNGSTVNYKSISIFVANLQMSKEYPNSKIVNINNSDSKASAEASGKFNFTVSIID